MRFKTLAAATLILLGIVVFSAYSGSNGESTQDDKEDIIQKIKVNNSSFPEVSEDWNGSETVVVDDSIIRKGTDNERAAESVSEADKNNIFKEIKLDNSSIKAPEPYSEFKTVIVNPSKFRELASNGTLNLSLMGEEYELKLQQREIQKPNVNFYRGYIVGKPQSSASFTVKNDSINGCINVDFFNESYGIAPTDDKYEGKTVHLLWRCYNEGAEEEFKKKYSLDPLRFSLSNNGKETHRICIELFDFYNKSVFKDDYVMIREAEIFSPEINVEAGYYRYKIVLDNEFTCEQTVRADYAAELSSSEKLFIYITDDPDNPIEFVSEIA